jgi:hypothetical protein
MTPFFTEADCENSAALKVYKVIRLDEANAKAAPLLDRIKELELLTEGNEIEYNLLHATMMGHLQLRGYAESRVVELEKENERLFKELTVAAETNRFLEALLREAREFIEDSGTTSEYADIYREHTILLQKIDAALGEKK